MTQSINNSRNLNNDTTTNQVAISDSCTTCVWLDKQPDGNVMLCILPGNCFWLSSWKDEDNA